MKYMGSKRRISKYILPIILKNRKQNQWYVEPFVGGANMIDKAGGNRIGSDNNGYLIALLKYIQETDPLIFPFVGEEKYKAIQKNKNKYPDWLVGYVGFNLSYGAKFFGGYSRDRAGIRNYENEAQQNLKAQQKYLIGLNFYCCDYLELEIPNNSLIYCDPPYRNTTNYGNSKFDYGLFWQWCKNKVGEGHEIFISEYNAPNDFRSIWEKEVNNTLVKNTGAKQGVERLFIHIDQFEKNFNKKLVEVELF